MKDLDLSVPDLGFFGVRLEKGWVAPVYVSRIPLRSVKKGLTSSHITFNCIQGEELNSLRVSLGVSQSNIMYNIFNRETVTLREALEHIEETKGAILHRNYAVVLKGNSEFPVIYFKTKPIAHVVKGKVVAIKGVDWIFLD
jgi:phosphoenolpyruvate carboxylase